MGYRRQRSGTPSASILCLPRPSPYGSSLSMMLGSTFACTLITNEDTLFRCKARLCSFSFKVLSLLTFLLVCVYTLL